MKNKKLITFILSLIIIISVLIAFVVWSFNKNANLNIKQNQNLKTEQTVSETDFNFKTMYSFIGKKVNGMTLKEINKIDNYYQLAFSGPINITADYHYFHDTPGMEGYVCFNNIENKEILPKINEKNWCQMEGGKNCEEYDKSWFCLDLKNSEFVNSFGAPGSSGKTTLSISDYYINYDPNFTYKFDSDNRKDTIRYMNKVKISAVSFQNQYNYNDWNTWETQTYSNPTEMYSITVKTNPALEFSPPENIENLKKSMLICRDKEANINSVYFWYNEFSGCNGVQVIDNKENLNLHDWIFKHLAHGANFGGYKYIEGIEIISENELIFNNVYAFKVEPSFDIASNDIFYIFKKGSDIVIINTYPDYFKELNTYITNNSLFIPFIITYTDEK